MADRNPGGPPAHDDYDRGDQRPSAKGKSDPLAELARLIGQTDPFNNSGRSTQPAPVRDQDDYDQQPALDLDERPVPARPTWMQRITRQEVAQQDLPSAVHPLKGYAANHAASESDYNAAPSYSDHGHSSDTSRYDDAHYDEHDTDARHAQHDPAYSDDPYAYQEDYGEEVEGQGLKKRRGGMVTVAVVLLLAVVGTGGAFAYRTYIGSPRSGEPPIIKADTAPNKIVPSSADAPAKMPDRIATGEGSEKIVPREEQPVDVNQNAGPRMVFPPLSSSPAFPSAASVTPPAAKPAPLNPITGAEEPRKIKTFPVRGDQSDIAATPAAKPAARTAPRPAANANASASNAPMSLSPTPAAEQRRVATTNSVPAASGAGSSGGYVVQISSQRNEADAQASYRALQGKFPSVLGSRAPLIKRADLGDKGVYYRAMVGPFGSPEEAGQLCGSLKAAGGQCVVQKN